MNYRVTTPYLDEVFQTLEEVELRVAGFAGNNYYKPLTKEQREKVEQGEIIHMKYGNLSVCIKQQEM